ncbi:hypothetical protein H6F84_04830 [Microcoleus sp. FACHB-84]|nr:hypothetical protein [Microcoleus sp. FACHB-84]
MFPRFSPQLLGSIARKVLLTFLRARFNRSIVPSSFERAAGFAVTELRYTVIANTFSAIASIAKAIARPCQISAIVCSMESISNLKSPISNRLTD